MILGVTKETLPGERRVSIVPAVIPALAKAGVDVMIQSGAGEAAGHVDSEYQSRGATVVEQRSAVFEKADIVCQVRLYSANPKYGEGDLQLLKRDQVAIGLADPLFDQSLIKRLAETGGQCFALELIPRITRAQAMDVLSSQATVVGYKAVLLAAERLPRMFPMMMTAAGTIAPAKVFIIGAGVAGLQAIATAKKMGAVVQAYDVRPAVKEQVESLGARFLQLDLATSGAEDKGGYAKAMDDTFYRKQREMMAEVVKQSDVVITTAAVPGAKPPLLITAEMVRSMPFGSIVVDIAARTGQTGGNCELTQPDDATAISPNNATVLGPTNLASSAPYTASQLFAKNVTTFVLNMLKDKQLNINMDDEIIAQTLMTKDGTIVNERLNKN